MARGVVNLGVSVGLQKSFKEISKTVVGAFSGEISSEINKQLKDITDRLDAVEQLASKYDGRPLIEGDAVSSQYISQLNALQKQFDDLSASMSNAKTEISKGLDKSVNGKTTKFQGFGNEELDDIYNTIKAMKDYDGELDAFESKLTHINERLKDTSPTILYNKDVGKATKQWDKELGDLDKVEAAIERIYDTQDQSIGDIDFGQLINDLNIVKERADSILSVFQEMKWSKIDFSGQGLEDYYNRIDNMDAAIREMFLGFDDGIEDDSLHAWLKSIVSSSEDAKLLINDLKSDFEIITGGERSVEEAFSEVEKSYKENAQAASSASDDIVQGVNDRIVALEREIEAEKQLSEQRAQTQQSNQDKFVQTSQGESQGISTRVEENIPHTVVSEAEIESLKELQAAVDAVTESVRAKNFAFNAEEDIVTNSIGKEVSALAHLEEAVKEVISKFSTGEGLRLDINIPVEALQKTAEQSAEVTNTVGSVDSLKSHLAELKDVLASSFDFSGVESSINNSVSTIIAAIDRVIAKLDILHSAIQAIAMNVSPTNVTEGLDKNTLDSFEKSIAAIQTMQKAVDKLVQSNKDLADSFKNAGSASKKYKVDPLFDADTFIKNDSQRLVDSSDSAIQSYLASKGEYGFNVMDRSIEKTQDGLVRLTAVVDSGGEHWRKFTTIIGLAGKNLDATIEKITGAQKQQSIYEAMLQRRQTLAKSATDDALFDVNRAGDLQKWSNILSEIQNKYQNIGEIQKIIYQTRQDKSTGTLLESFVVKGKNSSVTFGPNGEAVASNQEVVNLEQVEKKIKSFIPELKNYYKLKTQIADGSNPFDKTAQQQIDATNSKLEEINNDLVNISETSKNISIKDMAMSLEGEINKIQNEGFSKYIEQQISGMDKKLESDRIQRTNTNTGYSQELTTQIKEYQAIRDEVLQRLSSHLNGETWANVEIQDVVELTQKINGLNLSLKESSDKIADLMSVEKLLEKVAKYANQNTKNPVINQQFDVMIAELQSIIDRAKAANSAISDTDKLSLRNITGEFQGLKAQVEASGNTGLNFWDRLKQTISTKNIQFLSMYFSLFDVIRYIREAVSAIKEVDSAMVELRKVSNDSAQAINNSFSKMASSARELGSSVSDMISLTADWSRLGYNLPDSEELARVTQLYANVGDGISASEASDEMISTLKGFQMQADEAQKIVDSFNEVGNNFAISSAGIGAALQRSAAAFNAANTDLNQAIALTVAANDAVQDPDSVGTMWATVAARIRGAKTELEDLGEDTEDVLSTSKLRELVKGISGVDIMKDKSTFKDIYTIVDEIGQKWDSISDINQASLLEALAGKRQSNRLASALNNIEDLEAAYQTAENSAGSAEREQEEYAKSISYHMKSAQASIQEFVTTLASSGQINAIIDVFSGLVDGATKLSDTLGGIPSIVSAIVGAIAGAKGDWLSIVGTNKNDALWSINNAQQWNERTNLWENTGGIEVGGLIGGKKARNQQLQNIVQEFNDLDITAGDWEDRVAKLTVKYGDYGNAIKGFAENNKGAKITIEDLAGSTQALSIGAKAASFGVKALGVALNMVATTLIVAGIQLLITGIYNLATADKEAADAARELAEAHSENEKKIETYKGQIQSLRDTLDDESSSYDEVRDAKSKLIDIQDALIDTYGYEADGIDLVNGKLDEQIAKIDKLNRQEALSTVSQAKTPTTGQKVAGWFKYVGYNLTHPISSGLGQAAAPNEYMNNAYQDMQEQITQAQSNWDNPIRLNTEDVDEKDLQKILSVLDNISHVQYEIHGHAVTISADGENAYQYMKRLQNASVAVGNNIIDVLGNTDAATKFSTTWSEAMQKEIDSVSETIQKNKDLLVSAGEEAIYTNVSDKNNSGQTYQQMLGTINKAAEKYQEALKSGTDEEKQIAEESYAKAVADMYNVASENNQLGIQKYLEDAYQTIWNEVSSWNFEDAWQNATQYQKDSVSDAAKILKRDNVAIDDITSGRYASEEDRNAGETLQSVAIELGVSIEDLVASLIKSKQMLSVEQVAGDTIGKNIFGKQETKVKYAAGTGGTLNASTVFRDMYSGMLNEEEQTQVSSWGDKEKQKFIDLLGPTEDAGTKSVEVQQKMAETARATIKYFDEAANAVEDADSAIDSFYDTNKAVFDEIGVGQDDFKKYVKNLQKTDKELADNTEEALALALANEKLSYAFTDLNDNLETYQKLSKETSATKKQTPEWQGQMGQAATDLQMISGVSFNTDQTQKFLQDAGNVTLLKEAINGTEGALDSLYQKIIQYEGDEISSEVQNSLRAIMPELDTSTFEGEYNQFVAWIAQHRDIGNLTATADFNALPFIQHINNAVSSAQIGAQQMKDALKALEGVGVATEVTTETKYIPNVQKQLWQQYDFANKKFTKDIVSYSAGSPAYFKSDSVPIQVPKLTFKNLNSSGYSSKAPSGSGLYKSKSGGSGGGSGSKEKEPYSEDIDWIERASKKLTDNLHDIQGVVDDTFANWDGRLQHVAKEYENLTAQMDLAQKAREYYLKKANAVALPAEYKKKVLNGEINVETIRDENLKKLIEDYQSFWDKYVQYEQQFYDLSRERMAMLSKEIDMISQRWDDKISDVEHSSAMADLDVNTGDITGQLPALNKQRANAIQEISLVEQERAAIAKKMAEANVNHDSEEYQKWKKQLQKLDEKVVSLKENLQDIAKQKFDAINNQFEFLANQIDHANNRMQSLSDIATAMGYYASNEFIKTEKKVAEVNYANASARRDELQRSLNEAVANGAVKEGSDAWIEMKNAIEDATDSVFQYTAAIEQAKQKLRQWDWDAQDYINERTQRIFDTNQFFIDQLEQSKMFADNGGFIDRSNAQQGLHVSQYSIYLAEAKKYAEAIQDINDQLASDPYDIELIARRETLIDQQREMIKGAKSEKEAIRDLVKNSYDTFLDYLQMLIDKRKEALEAEQDLFEYEKNIREQTKQIASYQKQLSSIKADNSEENRLRIQQLTNSLTDAQEQLQETEHDRWRTDQEALMDQMYNSFEELINTRLDDIDGVLHEAIQRTTENTANIVATIQAEANRIGVDVSSSLNVLYTLDNTLNTQFGTLADDIANHTSTLVDNLDSQGQAIVDAGNRAAMTVTGDGHTTLADINNMLNNILAAIGRLQANINNYGYGSGGSSGGSRPSSSSSSSSSTVKGYRLYNPNGGGGQHLFTTSAAERDRLIKAGWREEAGSGFSTSGTAIQRYYNPNNGDHMYTINPTEQNTLKNAGWKYEGVAGYASGSGKTTYRLLNPNTGTHTFTSNPAEVAKLVAAGWKKEGTAWKDAAFAQGGTIGKAIKRTGEDGIILARTGEEVLSLDKIEGMKQVLAMFEPLAKMQQSAPNVKSTIGGSNVTVGDITTTLSLPNVENYEQFVEKAKADPRFEKLVQQMTLGNALGQSSLKKFNL